MTYIGIDPGVHTGFAVWNGREFTEIETLPIHKALRRTLDICIENNFQVTIVFEDARQRKWYSGDTNAKLQGAGSIKRDCTIWEDFCKEYGLPFQAVPPRKGQTKLTSEYFQKITGWKGRTSNHARDAAILVLGR